MYLYVTENSKRLFFSTCMPLHHKVWLVWFMEFNTTFNNISVILSGLSISYEVAGYFQKVGGEVEVLLCPEIFRPGVWGLQIQCVNL